jgi:2-dehydro-3-deoxygalactonokinase
MPRERITLVASGRLAMLYRLAFDTLSIAVQSIDADQAVLAGLARAAMALWTR